MTKKKRKIITLVVCPFVICFILISIIFAFRASGYYKISVVHKTIEFNIELAGVISEIQIERDLGAFYISNPTETTEEKLIAQYHLTDQVISMAL